MSFDARAYLEAVGRPVYTDTRGRKHLGQVISFQEWLPIQARINAHLEEGTMDFKAYRLMARMVTVKMFPRPKWAWLLGPFYRTVTKDVLSLPPSGMVKAVNSFMESQRRAVSPEGISGTDAPEGGAEVETAESPRDIG